MPPRRILRIASWNVNGLRSCGGKGFAAWLEGSGAEIVGLQEVRSRLEQLPEELASRPGWSFHLHAGERPGYSGVGLYARRPPDQVQDRFGRPEFDSEGRLQLARFGELLVVNGYFPNGNGKERDLSRIPYKLDFYRWLFDHLEAERSGGRPILVMGDFNTAHREIDLARPRENRETSGFRPEEREELDRWLRSGWTDTFRHFVAEGGHYSWWSQRFGVREKNVGWRLDYVLASPGAMEFLRGAAIHSQVTGSDHCPVSVDLDPAVLGPAPRRRLPRPAAGKAGRGH
ncbi:MAG: exodeoxyribonuclease III [Thermoanaerobaculia bacterium]